MHSIGSPQPEKASVKLAGGLPALLFRSLRNALSIMGQKLFQLMTRLMISGGSPISDNSVSRVSRSKIPICPMYFFPGISGSLMLMSETHIMHYLLSCIKLNLEAPLRANFQAEAIYNIRYSAFMIIQASIPTAPGHLCWAPAG
jgi:hypothetical protein